LHKNKALHNKLIRLRARPIHAVFKSPLLFAARQYELWLACRKATFEKGVLQFLHFGMPAPFMLKNADQ
jgi:hypothetical protein